MSGDVMLWELIRASGVIAYVLLSLSVILGIGVRTRALDWAMKRAWVYEGHQSIAAVSLAATALHVVLLLANSHVAFGPREILIPFVSSWRPLPTAAGIVAFYLLVLLVATSHVRSKIGERSWRSIHYAGFVAWVAALGHGVFAGSDSGDAWAQYMYLATGCIVAMLIVFRVLERAVVRPANAGRARA